TSVAWSPDGERIASGSGASTLRIWDAATGENLSTLREHDGWVSSVAWSPDGKRIASGSYDGTLRIWESRLEDVLPMWRAADRRRREAAQKK
ncbi:MAG: hypothetical protein GY871_14800, partial [Actinomycetales bacterium]|nr:hypothetical protein [Actinomycetales bacterium]